MNLFIISLILVLILGTLISPHRLLIIVAIAIALILFVFKKKLISICLTISIGLLSLWSSWSLHQSLAHRLPISLSGQMQTVAGCIVSTPERKTIPDSHRSYFRFVLEFHNNKISPAGVRKAQLSWYSSDLTLNAGDCITATAVLRTPRNLANDLAFDYEAYMLFQGIDATGYIRTGKVNEQKTPPLRWERAQILSRIIDQYPQGSARWIRGLVFGDKSAFSPEQWQQVRDTGTLHLLVVSGLHVGLVTFAAMFFGLLISRLLPLLSNQLNPDVLRPVTLRLIPKLLGILVATAYLYLAGAGISLLRAWIMAVVAVLFWTAARRVNAPLMLLIVALLLLVVNPLAWTQSGFWYSFIAVAALILAFGGKKTGNLTPWLVPQIIVLLFLLPVMAYWEQGMSLVHVLANAVAIPLVTFLLLPLSFVALLIDIPFLHQCLELAGDWFWLLLSSLQTWQLPTLYFSSKIFILGWCALLFLWVKGVRYKYVLIGCVCFLFCLGTFKPSLDKGVWLFDAGQGQSLMVSDGETVVVIDTGARFSEAFSIAGAVVVPWLHKIKASHLDALVISHADNDHAGGVNILLKEFKADYLVAGQNILDRLEDNYAITYCHQQKQLELSANLILYFYPIPDVLRLSDNDSSCIVQIKWFDQLILVPGDATSRVESYLVNTYGQALQSDLLVAGHHGSKTSSSSKWLEAVRPSHIWISSGYRNRFGHPHHSVLKNIEEQSKRQPIQLKITAQDGMIRMNPDGFVSATRDNRQPPWRVQ